ncbi:hypothetical protein [Novosphingobium olei]|uniref:hypothetical protein n=1 Tax=Novosphingobium olei TaxID=2728851 RepID=UPI0030CEC6FD
MQEMDKNDCPFSGHGADLINVKFFRGRRDDVIKREEILEQFRSANMQRRQKTATVGAHAPKSDHPVIDVKELVEAL